MKPKYWHVLLGIIFVLSTSITQAKDMLIWRVIDWPPFYILNGKDQGQGIYDVLIDKMIAAMPEYEHRKVVMNTQRVLAELKKGSKVCHPSALANTPAKLSITNSFLLPQRLIYHANDYPLWQSQENISLMRLLSDEQFNLGLATNRYPEKLNALIDFDKQKHNITFQNNYNSLIRMFFHGRIDGIIEYPPVITYSKQLFGENLKSKSLIIDELSNVDFLPVYFACPNNQWGEQVISKINQILKQEVEQPGYLDFRLKWYVGKNKALLNDYYQAHYLQDKQPK